jgi:hypothetical protein
VGRRPRGTEGAALMEEELHGGGWDSVALSCCAASRVCLRLRLLFSVLGMRARWVTTAVVSCLVLSAWAFVA